MIDDNKLEIIRKVAKQHGISPTVLARAWTNQFKVVKEEMQKAEKGNYESFPVIYLRRLGKFVPSKGMITHMTKNSKRHEK